MFCAVVYLEKSLNLEHTLRDVLHKLRIKDTCMYMYVSHPASVTSAPTCVIASGDMAAAPVLQTATTRRS